MSDIGCTPGSCIQICLVYVYYTVRQATAKQEHLQECCKLALQGGLQRIGVVGIAADETKSGLMNEIASASGSWRLQRVHARCTSYCEPG